MTATSGPRTGPTTVGYPTVPTAVRDPGAPPSWKPTRDDLVDAAFGMVLLVVAAIGWLPVFSGVDGPLVVLVGGLAGTAAAWVSAARRLSPFATLSVALLAFLLFSGVSVADSAIAGFLPGPEVPTNLVDGLIRGWSDLVTTATPVASGDGMAVPPYVCGFLAGLLGMLVAKRSDLPLVPAVPSMAALLVGFLFGDFEPAAASVQGIGFALVAVAWGAVRSNRPRRTLDGEVYWPRVVSGLVMLAIVGLVASVVGTNLPGVQEDERTVLRDAVPPFDPSVHPSPLAGLRTFRKAGREVDYLRASDLKENDLIRLATMDTYDGVVWSVGGSESSGRFDRVGSRIRYADQPLVGDPKGWPHRSLSVSVIDYRGIWLPTLGLSQRVSFAGTNADTVADAYRFDRASGTAASSVPVSEGLVIDLDARLLRRDDLDEQVKAAALPCSGGASLDPVIQSSPALAELQNHLREYTGGADTPFAKAEAIEERMKDGYFSDDLDDAEEHLSVRAGHSVAALAQFLDADQLLGNGEQYAASMAVLTNLAGLPTRVVVGFKPEKLGAVVLRGEDAAAWVEVCFADIGWVTFEPTPDESRVPDPPTVQVESTPPKPRPPVVHQQLNVPETIPENVKRQTKVPPKGPGDTTEPGVAVPWFVRAAIIGVGVPVALLLAGVAVIVGLKASRRRRRRTRGTAADQINGAWLEAVDHLRDVGHRPRPAATRRELAIGAASAGYWQDGLAFASAIDAHLFGPNAPSSEDSATAWSNLNQQVGSIHSKLTRRQRLRAAISLASMRRPSI